MTTYLSARAKKRQALLNPVAMERTMLRVLPRRNQMPPTNYQELIEEARDFDILTMAQFRALLLRHRRALIATNREPLTARDERLYRADWGDTVVSELLRRQVWFSWEAMTRLAFGFEFGEKYEEYLRERYPTPGREDGGTIQNAATLTP